MSRVLRQTDSDIALAHVSVHAPTYTILVADTTEATSLPAGWVFTPLDVEMEDLIQPWRAPSGAHDVYDHGAEVTHAGKRWVSTVEANVWEPGVSGWREVPPEGEHPAWVRPTGAHDAYPLRAMVMHSGRLWSSDREANVWEPGTADAGWRQTMQMVPPGHEAAWIDTGATVAQLVGAGIYRVSKVVEGLVAGQPIRLGTEETVFKGYWPTATTPSAHLSIAPHVVAPIDSTVWMWA
jgi:hypothetical protein